MDNTINISYLNLFLGYLLLIIPLSVFWYYKTGLIRATVIAAARMGVQLILIGIYLEYIFEWNKAWINISWVVIMIIIGAFVVTRRSGISYRTFVVPVIIALSISVVVVDAYFIGLVIRPSYFFESRYFIPVTGLLIGNSIRISIIALQHYYTRLRKDELFYRYSLANGATRNEALLPFIRDALQISFNPNIATMAIMGLIALPGTMTGQMIGGSSPSVAIKYQILLMLTVFVSSMITVILTILISNRYSFEAGGRLRKDLR